MTGHSYDSVSQVSESEMLSCGKDTSNVMTPRVHLLPLHIDLSLYYPQLFGVLKKLSDLEHGIK